MNGWADAFALAAIVLAGSTVQRMSGMGFALVAVPALVLLIVVGGLNLLARYMTRSRFGRAA